jgi:hypothetical protein
MSLEPGIEAPSGSYYGAVGAPTVGQTIVTSPALTPGVYTVEYATDVQGTSAAADVNNIQLQVGSTVISPLQMPNAVGTHYNGVPLNVYVPPGAPGGETISITAIGAGTSTATYEISLVVTRAE